MIDRSSLQAPNDTYLTGILSKGGEGGPWARKIALNNLRNAIRRTGALEPKKLPGVPQSDELLLLLANGECLHPLRAALHVADVVRVVAAV